MHNSFLRSFVRLRDDLGCGAAVVSRTRQMIHSSQGKETSSVNTPMIDVDKGKVDQQSDHRLETTAEETVEPCYVGEVPATRVPTPAYVLRTTVPPATSDLSKGSFRLEGNGGYLKGARCSGRRPSCAEHLPRRAVCRRAAEHRLQTRMEPLQFTGRKFHKKSDRHFRFFLQWHPTT